ncbi:polysaccharide deacetylase family protein [Candidatus Chloroploca sp. M-50]|uniref:Polysaccharide deacetylase family protein n=1 Tax=Candidatus Chloroploca mongolica TaxID=2528176 RepID=A0ABS4DBN2_9CHLR|nr:polysaccharide deacetylase family protein [Candidatus Chloroploca mongolica]MBP1466847.1 polysaccharide deacetylase family protein [Candidatus Chloroploca mongolica]
MPTLVRIALDPALAPWRPEVTWTWRTLLTGMGYAWVEQPWGSSDVDLAYATDPAQAPAARLVIVARPEHWTNPVAQLLAGIVRSPTWEHLRFQGELAEALQVTRHHGTALIERDVIFDAFWLLTGQEERQLPRGKHGYSDLSGSPGVEQGLLRKALASGVGTSLERELVACGLAPGMRRWPVGKTMAAACGHDVDYPEVVRWLEPLRILARQGRRGLKPALDVALGRRTHWHFASWMALEQRFQSRSAFYFVARQGSLIEYARGLPDTFYDVNAPRFRLLLRELAAEGWEIGLHASYLAYTSAEKFGAERAALAVASNTPVVGNRHHYWHLDPADPEATLLMHEQVGLTYDASLTHDRYLGWRRGTTWPFYPWHSGLRRPVRTLQVPTGWMDDHLFGHHVNNPGGRQALLDGLADRVADQEGCLLVDVHDYVYDDALFPDWAATYARLWETLFSRGDVWFATPAELAAHWVARAKTLEQASSGLSASWPVMTI